MEKFTNKLDAGYERIILELHKQLGTIHVSWSLSRFDQDRGDENVSLIEYFRGRTAMIRNWGDTEQVFEWLELMYSSDDSLLVERRGISFSKLIHTVRKLLSVLDERINDRKQLLRSVVLADSKEEMIKAYFKVDGVSGDKEQEGLKRMMALPYDLKGLTNILLLHFDRNLTDLFLFTKDDLPSFLDESEVSSVWAVFDE